MQQLSVYILSFTITFFLGCSKDNVVQRINENNTTSTNSSDTSYKKITKEKVSLVYEDITKIPVDAIVNAANAQLNPGGGVCGAIYTAAGYDLLDSHIKNNIPFIPGSSDRCNIGDAKITPGFNLTARFIIHAVGPVYSNYSDAQASNLLASAYTSSLQVAKTNNLRTVAFPCISTAIFGYPKDKAAPIALNAIKNFLASNDSDFDEIIIVCYGSDGKENYKIYESLI
ncbi:MAG: macro domain-containing protein [Endomicrobium sp.]|jgi:O-acetyl-ADP-ribose deacetylase (regulator of RNase III)|nr:macro domain-containing protein [Endomicrobium sp.]